MTLFLGHGLWVRTPRYDPPGDEEAFTSEFCRRWGSGEGGASTLGFRYGARVHVHARAHQRTGAHGGGGGGSCHNCHILAGAEVAAGT